MRPRWLDRPRLWIGSIPVADWLTRWMAPEQRLKLHEDRIVTLTRRHGADSAPVAFTRIEIAQRLEELGRFDEARPQFEEALAVYKRHLGEEHCVTLNAEAWLATNQWRSGKYEEAQATVEHVLALSERILGSDHKLTRWALHFLRLDGSSYQEGGDIADPP